MDLLDIVHFLSILDGYRGNGTHAENAKGLKRFQICLNARTARRIRACNRKGDSHEKPPEQKF
jgi:hypothetical protein